MSASFVNDDVVLAGRVPLKRALAPLDSTPQRSGRHDAIHLGVAVDDLNDASVDLDDWRLIDERRELLTHERLPSAPSRVVAAAITCVSIKAKPSLRLNGLASAAQKPTACSAVFHSERAAPKSHAPDFGAPIAKLISPVMGTALIHSPPKHHHASSGDRR